VVINDLVVSACESGRPVSFALPNLSAALYLERRHVSKYTEAKDEILR
jgi:hypothetical protein